jgi:hypothetical protein
LGFWGLEVVHLSATSTGTSAVAIGKTGEGDRHPARIALHDKIALHCMAKVTLLQPALHCMAKQRCMALGNTLHGKTALHLVEPQHWQAGRQAGERLH